MGVLWHAGNEQEEGVFFTSLKEGFSDLGYIEGQTVIFEHTYAAEQYERFDANAAALVARNVDVIIAVTRTAAVAAKRATTSIPIVFAAVPDPVGIGLVASLAHPGGNITGWTPISSELVPKRIQLLKEAVPGISGLALLVNASDPVVAAGNIAEAQDAAKKMSIRVRGVEVRSPDDFVHAFDQIAEAHLDGVVVGTDPLMYNERKRIAELALAHRLPTMLFIGGMVAAGGLMSYGPNYPTLFRRTAYYVDKILKGTKPADLPVEQPTKFNFVINLKTAKALGLDVPPSMLARADEVIE